MEICVEQFKRKLYRICILVFFHYHKKLQKKKWQLDLLSHNDSTHLNANINFRSKKVAINKREVKGKIDI